MKNISNINNIDITAWSIALVLSIGGLAITLSKDVSIPKEEVSKSDDIETKKKKNEYHRDVEFISTAMEEYRSFDSNATTNVYLYQVHDEITDKWVTLDIISKKEYQLPPELLRDGRIIYAGNYSGDKDMGVYVQEIRKNNKSEWERTENYSLLEEAPFETSTMRYVYIGEDINHKVLKLD